MQDSDTLNIFRKGLIQTMTTNQITKNMYTLFYGKNHSSQTNIAGSSQQDTFLNWLNTGNLSTTAAKTNQGDTSDKTSDLAALTNRSTSPVLADSIKMDTLQQIFSTDNQGITGYEHVAYYMDYSSSTPRIIMETTLGGKHTYYEMDPSLISGDRASNSELLGYYAYLQAQGENVDMEQLMTTISNASSQKLLSSSSCTALGFLTVSNDWYDITENMQQNMWKAGDITNATKTESVKEQLPTRLPFDNINEWMAYIKSKKNEIYEKIVTGQTQPAITTGAASFTQDEWDKMIQKMDENIDEIKEELKKKEEKAKEEEITKDMLKKLLMDKELLKPDGKSIITDIDIVNFVIGITHTEAGTQVVSKAAADITAAAANTSGATADSSNLSNTASNTTTSAPSDSTNIKAENAGSTDSKILDTEEIISTQVSAEETAHLMDGWYITAFTPQGIECRYCKQGEPSKLMWSLSYGNPTDRKRVENFLARFDDDANLSFVSDKNFWQDFMANKIDEDKFIFDFLNI